MRIKKEAGIMACPYFEVGKLRESDDIEGPIGPQCQSCVETCDHNMANDVDYRMGDGL